MKNKRGAVAELAGSLGVAGPIKEVGLAHKGKIIKPGATGVGNVCEKQGKMLLCLIKLAHFYLKLA